MSELKFKTNINCGSCVKTVTPFLDKDLGEGGWSVDTDNADKILTVSSENATEEKVVTAVKKAGFTIEKL